MFEMVPNNARKLGLEVSALCGIPSPASVRGRGVTGIDYGAPNHMTSCTLLFTSYSPFIGNRNIKIADGSFSIIAASGSIKISPSITLENVLHVPKLSCYLISISQLTHDLKYKVNFYH